MIENNETTGELPIQPLKEKQAENSNIINENEVAPVTEQVKWTRDKNGKLVNGSAVTQDDYAKDFATLLQETAEAGKSLSKEDRKTVVDTLKDKSVVRDTLQKYGDNIKTLDDFNNASVTGKLKTKAADVEQAKVEDKKDDIKATTEAKKQMETATKKPAVNTTTTPEPVTTRSATTGYVDYSKVTPENYAKDPNTTAKGLVQYLRDNGKTLEDAIKYVGISDNLDDRIANEYGYSVVELNNFKKNGIPNKKYKQSLFLDKETTEANKKRADELADIIDDPNASEIDKVNAKAELLNIQAVTAARNSTANIIGDAADAAKGTKDSAKKLVDAEYLDNLPKSLVAAYTSGRFGDPDSDEAKARLGYFILDNIATGLSNFRIGRSSPAFGDKQSKYDAYLSEELKNAVQRKNDTINKTNDATLEILKKGGMDQVDFDNAIAEWSKDETLSNYASQLDATKKANAVLAQKTLGEFLIGMSDEDKNAAAYAALLLSNGDINQALPLLQSTGIDVNNFLKKLAETKMSDASLSIIATKALDTQNQIKLQDNSTANALKIAQDAFNKDIEKLDINYQNEMNKLKQELQNNKDMEQVKAEWADYLDKNTSWRHTGQDILKDGISVITETAKAIGSAAPKILESLVH